MNREGTTLIPTQKSATTSETTNALVLVRSYRFAHTRKMINPFPVIVRTERSQQRIQNQLFIDYTNCSDKNNVAQFSFPKINNLKTCADVVLAYNIKILLTYAHQWHMITKNNCVSLGYIILEQFLGQIDHIWIWSTEETEAIASMSNEGLHDQQGIQK